MKYILLFFLFISGNMVVSQQNVILEIQHRLKDVPFAFNQSSENNLGHAFTLRRMDYYLSGIEIIHDGGSILSFPDLYVLVSLDENQVKTTVDLGTHDVENIEKIKFYLGIDSLTNHADPALWPIGHPLGPRFPSMHWGWASGYRFIALEGKGGPANNQEIQLHALGNQYHQLMSYDVTPLVDNQVQKIVLMADYTELFHDMPIKQGVIVHGSDKEIVYLADNFIHRLFTAQSPTSVSQETDAASVEVFPNPAHDFFTLRFDEQSGRRWLRAKLTDAGGKVITEKQVAPDEPWFVRTPGVYFLHLYRDNGNPPTIKKVVIH